MYGLDEAQKGVGGKPPNNKEIQKVTDNSGQVDFH